MNDEELERLLNDLESDRVERKSSISGSSKDKICKSICAFANDFPNHKQPGVVFVGINDNGTCANLSIDDKLLMTLANIRSDGNILPFPVLKVQKKTLKGCEIAVIFVEPSENTPVRYDGRVWIRVGPTTRQATAQEERLLNEKRRSKDLPFDLQSISYATLDDLDLDLFRRIYLPSALPIDILEQNERSIEQQLVSMRFATKESAEAPLSPTVLGLLVAGKDPCSLIPGAYIQFVRFDGPELNDPIKDQKEISGALSEMLQMLENVFRAHISVASDITADPIELQYPDYPLIALQQLARNAVLHRNYEGTNAPIKIYWFRDRIEMHNPGGPFGQVTRQNFGQGINDYRNPNLAGAMKNLGYVQRFGVGIPIAQRELAKNENPPLEFTVENTHIIVTIRRKL
jgi:ATP-dependent DNA helicase RecG